MLKSLFLHQYLQDLGLENFFSHHYLYKKTFQIIFFIFQIWGPPLHCTSDRPCQRIIFPIEKSLHEFGARIFFLFLCSIFIFAFSPPPITFLMVRPYKY
jgi:hypothetical protein